MAFRSLTRALRRFLHLSFHRLRFQLVTFVTSGKFSLAFKVHTCHNWETARREAHRPQVQEGHSIGCLEFGKHNPNSVMESSCLSALQSGASAARGVSGLVCPSHRILRIKQTGTASKGFPNVLTTKKKEKVDEGAGRSEVV